VAYTIGWTAISSELSYYSVMFGPQMLLALNAAYFLPSVPVLLCQTLWDQHFDRWAGAAAATATRFLVGARRGGVAHLRRLSRFEPSARAWQRHSGPGVCCCLSYSVCLCTCTRLEQHLAPFCTCTRLEQHLAKGQVEVRTREQGSA